MIMKLLAALHLFLDEWTYCWLKIFGMLLLKVVQIFYLPSVFAIMLKEKNSNFKLEKRQQHVKTNKRERYTILTTQINFVKGLMVFVRFVLCNNASNVNENWLISYFQN